MPTLHIVGDSISIQYGPHLQKFLIGTPWIYSRKEGPVGNIDHGGGANGGDSAMVLGYLTDCAHAGKHWDLLLVNCGLHDIKTDPITKTRQIPEETYRKNLAAIISLAPRLAPRLIWIRTTAAHEHLHNHPHSAFLRFRADQQRYNAIADDVMRTHRIPTIDLEHFTNTIGGDDIFCDHVHYTDAVRTLQAAYLAGWLTAQT